MLKACSAEYGLRSYTILVPFACFAKVMYWVLGGDKVSVFYAIRCLLAFLCSLGETLFIAGTRRIFGRYTSTLLYLFLLFSSGMFVASTSFVNSTLAMIFIFTSYGLWMRFDNHFLGLLLGAMAVVYAWPFAGIAFIPMGLDCLYRRGWRRTLQYFVCIASLVLGVDLAVNYHYTHRIIIPAMNIVLYNVLGIGGGPEVPSIPPFHLALRRGALVFLPPQRPAEQFRGFPARPAAPSRSGFHVSPLVRAAARAAARHQAADRAGGAQRLRAARRLRRPAPQGFHVSGVSSRRSGSSTSSTRCFTSPLPPVWPWAADSLFFF